MATELKGKNSGEAPKAQEICSEIALWSHSRNSVIHQLVKLGERETLDWDAHYREARRTAEAGMALFRKLDRLVRNLNRPRDFASGLYKPYSPSAPPPAFPLPHQPIQLVTVSAAVHDWTLAQIPGSAVDLDQLVCDGKTLRGSIEVTAGSGYAFIAQVTLYSAEFGLAVFSHQVIQ